MEEILAVPFYDEDSGAHTVGQYFRLIAFRVWVEDEGFSGKRPFGNSGWCHEVIDVVMEHFVIEYDEAVDQITYALDEWSKIV